MPEQLTKHPEVTLQVLRSAGAKCGEGASPDILTKCPAERLCKLPGGEICIFGVAEAQRMTRPDAYVAEASLKHSDWTIFGRGELTDKAWAQLAPLLPGNQRRGGRWRVAQR